MKLSVPVRDLTSPSSWGNRDQIKRMLERIWSNYGKFIQDAEKNSGIPTPVLAAFIAVESGGNEKAGPAGHITQGLMQWNRTFAKKQIEREIKNGELTDGEKQILQKYGVMTANGSIREVTNADQLKPELNIAIGSIVLGQLIDQPWAKDAFGNLALDRVIAVYNAGAYGATGKAARQLTTPKLDTPSKLAAGVNTVTRSYIAKILGVNGSLDITTSDLQKTIV